MGERANPLKSLEAGTGIEPVFTDLQSRELPGFVKPLGALAYQDKGCTGRERGTPPLAPENENPGALAGATGAIGKGSTSTKAVYSKRGGNAMSRHAKVRHKRVARMLGYALTAGDPVAWGGLSVVIGVRLTPVEVASIAFAALRALEPAEREAVYTAAHWGVV